MNGVQALTILLRAEQLGKFSEGVRALKPIDGDELQHVLREYAHTLVELAKHVDFAAADAEVQRLKRVPRAERTWEHQIELGKAQKRAAAARKAINKTHNRSGA